MTSLGKHSNNKTMGNNEVERNNNCQKILDNCSYITYLIDVTVDKRFIYRNLNNAYNEITGLNKEELLDTFLDEIKNEDLKEVLIQKSHLQIQTEQVASFLF